MSKILTIKVNIYIVTEREAWEICHRPTIYISCPCTAPHGLHVFQIEKFSGAPLNRSEWLRLRPSDLLNCEQEYTLTQFAGGDIEGINLINKLTRKNLIFPFYMKNRCKDIGSHQFTRKKKLGNHHYTT